MEAKDSSATPRKTPVSATPDSVPAPPGSTTTRTAISTFSSATTFNGHPKMTSGVPSMATQNPTARPSLTTDSPRGFTAISVRASSKTSRKRQASMTRPARPWASPFSTSIRTAGQTFSKPTTRSPTGFIATTATAHLPTLDSPPASLSPKTEKRAGPWGWTPPTTTARAGRIC